MKSKHKKHEENKINDTVLGGVHHIQKNKNKTDLLSEIREVKAWNIIFKVLGEVFWSVCLNVDLRFVTQ